MQKLQVGIDLRIDWSLLYAVKYNNSIFILKMSES